MDFYDLNIVVETKVPEEAGVSEHVKVEIDVVGLAMDRAEIQPGSMSFALQATERRALARKHPSALHLHIYPLPYPSHFYTAISSPFNCLH